MQKQKTIAKWLAIIVLCSVAVGSYLLYDALYVDKQNNQATADNTVQTPPEEPKVDVEVHVPYYTTLPRASESINGVEVSHFGGEGDDRVHSLINYSGKRYAFFTSGSKEFDVKNTGLHVAVLSDSLEKVAYLGELAYVDGKMSKGGIVLLAKNSTSGILNLIGANGEKNAEISLPYFEDGKLYLSGSDLILFLIVDGYIKCYKILENMTLQNCPFLSSTPCDSIAEVFNFPNGQVLILTKNESVSIFTYEQNNGFTLVFSRDKLAFRQIISAGTADSSNYIIFGLSDDVPTLISFDTTFQVSAIKRVEGASDGVVFRSGDGVTFVGNGVSATFCKHLDEIANIGNKISFSSVLAFCPTRQGILAVAEGNENKKILLIDSEIILSKNLDITGEIVRIQNTSTDSFSILLNTPSALDYFRGNFGGFDPYLLDFDYSIFQ